MLWPREQLAGSKTWRDADEAEMMSLNASKKRHCRGRTSKTLVNEKTEHTASGVCVELEVAIFRPAQRVSTRWFKRKEKAIARREAIAHRSGTPRWRPLARHMR